MPEQPLVSIIVPIYNAQDHIARCVESIRRQTYKNIEAARTLACRCARCTPGWTTALC